MQFRVSGGFGLSDSCSVGTISGFTFLPPVIPMLVVILFLASHLAVIAIPVAVFVLLAYSSS